MTHSTLSKALALASLYPAALAAAVASAPAAAQDLSFAGKRINVIIGTSPGGGTDGTSRLLGRFFEKYLPGNPRMVYRNIPAGNGTQGTNYFANEAARDGTAWAGGDNSYIGASTLRDPVVKFDPRTFNFIGGIVRGGTIMIMAKDKQANLTDKSKPPVFVGTPTGTHTWAEMMVWGAEALGWNIRFVIGYPGTASMVLALRRGEITGFGTSNLQILQSLEKLGTFVPAVQSGQFEKGKVVPRAAYAQVPNFPDMIHGKLTGLTAEAFDFWLKSDQIDKWFALPPKTPAAVVKIYIGAFEKIHQDPEFVKAGKIQFGDDFGMQTAADLAEIVKVRSYPRNEILNEIRRLKEKHGLPADPLTKEELAALSAKLVKNQDVKSTITKVEREGRVAHFKAGEEAHHVSLSDSRTKITIAGKKAKRAALKEGMTCRFVYPGSDSEAESVDCP